MKKIITGILAAVVMAAGFTGCNKVKEENYLSYSNADESSSQQDDDNNAAADDNAAANPDTADWTKLTFGIDSALYTPEFNLTDLTDAGWSFDPSIYGLENYDVIPGLKLSCDVYLNHEGVDDGVLAVGFCNTGSEDIPLENCQVWSVRVDVKDKSNYPQFSIPGNINWGTSEDDIKTALGEPSESNRDDTQSCTEMIYNKDGSALVHYYVYDDDGMLKFWIEKY